MNVRVRLFGALAERAGLDETPLDLPEGATAGDALGRIVERHPRAGPLAERLSVAVNLEVVPPGHLLAEGDEVALLPPVAGGATVIVTELRDRDVDPSEALAAVASPGAGGAVAFVGTVRDQNRGAAVERLEYSAYPEMAERVMRRIAEEAAARWPLFGVAILHATGDLGVGDPTFVVACSSAHRGEAFEAARYCVDEVKRRVPIWKRETGPGGERWIGLDGPGDARATEA